MKSKTTHVDSALQAQAVAPDRIPIIDLTPLLEDNDPRPVASAVLAACEDLGFFYVAHHGIDATLQQDFFANAQRFFSLPMTEKLQVDARTGDAFRGYFPIHAENNDPDASLDLKEGFDIMAEAVVEGSLAPSSPFAGVNQWPSSLAEFRRTSLRYYDALAELAAKLMQAVAVSLDLPADYFSDKLDGPLAILRILHYPSQSGHIDRTEIGTGAHTDYGLLTLLAQHDMAGLQIKGKDGVWIDAPPIAGTFVVNVGDALQRWSNDRFNSNEHRVINVTGNSRYSAPFFFHASEQTMLECLPTCQSDHRPPRYEPMRAGEYLLQRYRATFAHVAEQDAS